VTFSSLGLPNAILKGIRAAGFTEPTAIQSKAIPTILQGNDLIGAAQSGSGKTGAYVIPILARLLDGSPRLRAIVLTPTRELANYVETRIRDYARFTEIRAEVVAHGVPLAQNEKLLREQPVDILVATPGRLLELHERKVLNVENVEILVLEEADKMVALGLGPELRRLLKLLPETRQTLMFTMTLPPELNRLAKEALIEPVRVDLAPAVRPGAGTRQTIFPVPRDLKADLLNELLVSDPFRPEVRNTVLFARARYGAERLARQLQRRGRVAMVLDEHPSQGEREQAIEDLRRGRIQVLVASDAVGRSLDVTGITHVVNYDVPTTPEDYAHRLGRPGRPETPGHVLTLMSPEEQKDVAGIERLLGRTIERTFLSGFDYGMKPREIVQSMSFEDELVRSRRAPAGLPTAAVRIANAPRAAAAKPAGARPVAAKPAAARPAANRVVPPARSAAVKTANGATSVPVASASASVTAAPRKPAAPARPAPAGARPAATPHAPAAARTPAAATRPSGASRPAAARSGGASTSATSRKKTAPRLPNPRRR
jgi:ATP-dependent RNA helicase RhlE